MMAFINAAPATQLHDEDFPTKSSPPADHPKIILFKRLIEEHAEEYDEAAQKSEERMFQGRQMRCKQALLDLVVDRIVPADGYYKKPLRDGTWKIDESYSSKNLRKRVSNDFNKYLKSTAVAQLLPHSDEAFQADKTAEAKAIYVHVKGPLVAESYTPDFQQQRVQTTAASGSFGHRSNLVDEQVEGQLRMLANEDFRHQPANESFRHQPAHTFQSTAATSTSSAIWFSDEETSVALLLMGLSSKSGFSRN